MKHRDGIHTHEMWCVADFKLKVDNYNFECEKPLTERLEWWKKTIKHQKRFDFLRTK